MKNSSSFGAFLNLVIRGTSHGNGIRFEMSNFPGGFTIDEDKLEDFMSRRAPGRDELSTTRYESDSIYFENGVEALGVTDGETIVGIIKNQFQNSRDYDSMKSLLRPGHADYGQFIESGEIAPGGGMNSGRLTAAICGAGGICLQYLESEGINITASVQAIHGNCEDPEGEILKAKAEGDSVGGTIVCTITGLNPGIGGALFNGLESALSAGLFSIPGLKGVEFGNGFDATFLKGSENNDPFILKDGKIRTKTNNHGGILGGRTTGMPLVFRVAIKPTPTIAKVQKTVDVEERKETIIEGKGRHDPCIVRRALPVVEAITAFTILDQIFVHEKKHPKICLTLTGSTLEENYEQLMRERDFVDIVELRVDLLNKDEWEKVYEFPEKVNCPTILTLRNKKDGGNFVGDAEEHCKIVSDIINKCREINTRFTYLDFEQELDSTYPGRRLYLLALQSNMKVIRSMHVFGGSVKDAVKEFKLLKGVTDDIPKLAFLPRSEKDVEYIFKETKDFNKYRHIVCAMGEMGLPTRVSANRTNSFLTYTSFDKLESLGHVSPRNIRRFKKFGVIGHPISHSLSPIIHRANFKAINFLGTYERFDVKEKELLSLLQYLRDEGFLGVNITLPYKAEVYEFLSYRDENVIKYHSCNTIRFEADGSFSGFNTDIYGLKATLKKYSVSLLGKNVCVMGRGGVGSLISQYATEEGANVRAFGRDSADEAISFARDADLIINATPVGLKKSDKSVLPEDVFNKNQIVLDLIPTNFMPATAKAGLLAGARVIDGLDFLVEQGAKSFEIWTGKESNREAMINSVRRK